MRRCQRLHAVRLLCLAALFAALSAAVFLAVLSGGAPETIALGPYDRLRVAKISLGTNHFFSLEPWWKQRLRSALPNRGAKALGSAEEWRTSTPHSTLVVWVDEIDAAGKRHGSRLEHPAAVLENGVMGVGRVVELPNRTLRLEFSSFARDQEKVPLQMRYGTNAIRFNVRNPWRVTRPVWNAASLAQTNRLKGAEVVLGAARIRNRGDAVPEYEVMIRTRSKPRTGWFSWRVTTFDDLGNWSSTRPQYSSVLRIPGLPRTDALWALEIEGREYISAGFLEPLQDEKILVLHPDKRARAYGVQAMLYVEPGHYAVTNGVGTSEPALFPSPEAQMQDFARGRGTNWSLRFSTPNPAILCIGEVDSDEAMPQVRVRERLPHNRGRIFPLYARRNITNATGGRMWVATLSPVQIPNNATNAEVEIVGASPPMMFSMPPR